MRISPYRALFPDTKLIASSDTFFSTVKHQYPKFVDNGFFIPSSQEAFYVYQIKQGGKKHLGLLACTNILDYLEGHVIKHEHVLAAKEQKTTELLLERKAAIKPVLFTHPKHEELHDFLLQLKESHKKLYKIVFEGDQIEHKIYRITDGDALARIREFYKHIPRVYIADGHHRTATTAHLYEMQKDSPGGIDVQWLHTAFFSFDQLVIHDYNRVVHILEELSHAQLIVRLSNYFDMEELSKPAKPEQKFEITMLLQKEWFRLRWRKEILEQHKEEEVLLDAALFDYYVLQKVAGIEDVKEDHRVQYIQGPKGVVGVKEKVRKTPFNVGFCLPPVTIEEFIRVSDAGKTLPPKSTWFEPRLKNGVIVQPL